MTATTTPDVPEVLGTAPAAERFEFSASYDKGQTWRAIMIVDKRQTADQIVEIMLAGSVSRFTTVRTADGLAILSGNRPRWRWRKLP